MKIGILTLPLHTNYGGILQAYALQTVLERMGHEAFVIKNEFPLPIWRKVEKKIKNFLLRESSRFPQINPGRIIKFISEKQSRQCDAIIVGSDQVWRYIYIKSNVGKYYLKDYDHKTIRLSYAASFGIDTWDYPEEVTRQCTDLIKSFRAVSVREKSGVSLCKQNLGSSATQVLDPTLLLSKKDYLEKLEVEPIAHCLSSFILDPTIEKSKLISQLEQKYASNKFTLNKDVEQKLTIKEFIQHLAGSEFLVTDSFHGTAFAINFNIPFVVLGNPKRGQTRLSSILDTFGLTDRLLLNSKDIEKIADQKIDWSSVNKTLNTNRSTSVSFLGSLNVR